MKPLPLLAAAFVLSPLAPAVLAQADPDAANWPGFRGPGGRGVVADNPRLPEQWDSETNVEWKVEVPGTGWSSPVVWGDKVLLTSAVNEADSEPPKPGLYFGGNRPTPKTVHRWIVHCVDLESGKTLWEHTVHRGAPPHGRHLKNSFASETPVTDGVRFYCYFGNVGLFAFDMDGKRLWERKWKAVKTRYNWGTAASPVLHNGRLYLINDNDDGSFLECLNAKDGETVWRTARPNEKSNWSTPCVWEHEGRTEIVTTGSGKARSYDLDGKQLWSLGGMSSITVPAPFVSDGLLYFGSGYVGDGKRPFLAMRPGAKGELSLEDASQAGSPIVWLQPKGSPYMPTPIAYRDRLYVLLDRGMLSGYDAKTGERLYDRERIGKLTKFTSSPWAYNGKIFCVNESGDTAVIEVGDAFKLLRVNPLGEMCMATPAIAGDRLLIRTIKSLFCIRKDGAK